MASHITPPEETRKIESILSVLLRIGVCASLAIILFGTIVTFVHHPSYRQSAADLPHLIGEKAEFPHTLGQTWSALREFRGQAIVIVGLLLLILTPVMRVTISIFAFAYEEDWNFVWITSVVLLFLVISFLLGKAG
jgi:uncharacterized membrane protein